MFCILLNNNIITIIVAGLYSFTNNCAKKYGNRETTTYLTGSAVSADSNVPTVTRDVSQTLTWTWVERSTLGVTQFVLLLGNSIFPSLNSEFYALLTKCHQNCSCNETYHTNDVSPDTFPLHLGNCNCHCFCCVQCKSDLWGRWWWDLTTFGLIIVIRWINSGYHTAMCQWLYPPPWL